MVLIDVLWNVLTHYLMHGAWVRLSIFITVMKTLKVLLVVLGTQLPPPVAHQTFLLLFRCSFVCPTPSLSLRSYLLILGATVLLATCLRAVLLDHVTEITKLILFNFMEIMKKSWIWWKGSWVIWLSLGFVCPSLCSWMWTGLLSSMFTHRLFVN